MDMVTRMTIVTRMDWHQWVELRNWSKFMLRVRQMSVVVRITRNMLSLLIKHRLKLMIKEAILWSSTPTCPAEEWMSAAKAGDVQAWGRHSCPLYLCEGASTQGEQAGENLSQIIRTRLLKHRDRRLRQIIVI